MKRNPHQEIALTEREIGLYGAPRWALEMVQGVSLGTRQPPPSVDLVPVRSTGTFGGRYFPRRNAVLVYQGADEYVTHGTVVHELAHWRSYVESCGRPSGRSSCGYHGDHNAAFYRVLGPLYRAFGVTGNTIEIVEGRYPFPRQWITRGPR